MVGSNESMIRSPTSRGRMEAARQPVDLLRRGLAHLPVIPYVDAFEAQVAAGCREMHAESLFHRRFVFNEAKTMAELKAAAAHPQAYFRICVKDGEVLGGLYGMISGIFFSDDLVAADRAFFVKKTHRGSLAASSLLNDFEQWAKSCGVHDVLLEQATGLKMEATAAYYKMRGYEPFGVNTVKRI